jgi:hypothetical protein
MVEAREWGNHGRLLPDLQEKFNTYLTYVTEGQLASDYPQVVDLPIEIELRCSTPPGEREEEFLRIVTKQHLKPAGIGFSWKLIKTAAN